MRGTFTEMITVTIVDTLVYPDQPDGDVGLHRLD